MATIASSFCLWLTASSKVGINPLAKPCLLFRPTQALRKQDVIDPAALHGNALDVIQVRFQTVECPGSERQTQRLRTGESRSDNLSHLFCRVCGWTPRA
jgi:hypothetical protein